MTLRPAMELEVKVTGFYKLKKILGELSHKGYYRGIFKNYITRLLAGGTQHARFITHKDTGDLARSHAWEYNSHTMRGSIYISGKFAHARGKTVQFPRVYGIYEHARGGQHAFYQRTYDEYIKPKGYYGLRIIIRSFDDIWRQ